jgi:hypothetical protein
MSESPEAPNVRHERAVQPDEPVRYLTHHVLAVLDPEEQLVDAAESSISGGCLETLPLRGAA